MLDLNSLVSFFVLGTIGWVTYKVFIWPYYVSPLRKIPGPSTTRNPFYDSLLSEEGEPQSKWVKEYGSIVRYNGMLNRPTVLVADPKIIHEIAVKQAYDFVKPADRLGNLIAITGKGILLAEGENHKRQRKMMNPAFAHIHIKEMIPSFTRVALRFKDLIEDKLNAGESKINLTADISKATLDIIGLVGFNYEFNSLTSSNELASAYEYLMRLPSTALRIILRSLSNNIPFVRKIPINEYIRFNNECKVIERVSKQLIEEKYRDDENNNLNNDLLSILINTNKKLPVEEKMTDDELRYQIMTFLVAGHETTSTSTGWALYLLAQHPHEQDLLREELVKAFPDKSKFNPTFDEINSLEYLNYVVKETLRLYSPVTTVNRTNTKDKFFNGYFIPKNSTILVAISALHKSPSIWGPTAGDFDPKRWTTPENISSLNYLPFYSGPKTCIGNKLALAEFKVLLSMLVRNFVFQPVEGFNIGKRSFPLAKPEPHIELIVSRVEA